MAKAVHCEDCKYREWIGVDGLLCNKGHKPRFYQPTGNPYFSDWGWKRRCDDFKLGSHVLQFKPYNAEGNLTANCLE